MVLEYSLDKPDFLECQLFIASKSERVIKSRRKARLVVPITYLILGLLLFLFTDIVFTLIFITIGLIWYLYYPYYIRKRYVRHFEKALAESYKNRFGKLSLLKFGEEIIEITDYIGETKIRIQEIEEINEIKNYLFLKLSSGESLIIPKDKIKEENEFRHYISMLTERFYIKYNVELNWKWR